MKILGAPLYWLAAVLGIAATPAAAATSTPTRTQHVEAQLFSQTTGAAPGSTLYVALRQKITPGWHTYWRNPGDAGQATSLAWTLPKGWTAGDIIWPTPERYVSGPLMNYVFSGEVYLPIPITVPADAKPGQTLTLTAAADWLVCKDVCVPEDAKLSIAVPVQSAPSTDQNGGAAIAAALATAPKPAGLVATFSESGGGVQLAITGAAVKGLDVAHAYFFPYNGAVIEQIKPQQAQRGPDGLTMVLSPGYDFQHGKPPATLDGVIDLGGGHAFEVVANKGAPMAGASGLTPLVTTQDGGPGTGSAAGGGPKTRSAFSLPGAILFALVGGMILNLMPCVFPVLSMKAAAIARHGESPAQARSEALAFLAGTVTTFVVLAGLLIAAQQAGQAVGWGFQLQSPIAVAVLALLMLAVALNLSGVFEVGLSAQGVGQTLAGRTDWLGAFFTGALAVVVAAPCTAPFMAPAIGWALVQPPVAALCVFAALGVGLALPFVAVSFIPALFRLLPRPGAWMDLLRKVLAFPMYGAAAWLAWVFVIEAGTNALPFLFAAAVVLSLAAFLWGISQSAARPWISRALAVIALVAAAPLCLAGAGMAATNPTQSASTAASGAAGGLPTEVWSPEKVASLRAAGKPVFVDFTAAWCVTCQVNERTALATPEVLEAFKRTGAIYLKADWTNRNAAIAGVLTAEGRSGVPLYLLYDASGSADPKILPQLLTSGEVVEALNAAAKSA